MSGYVAAVIDSGMRHHPRLRKKDNAVPCDSSARINVRLVIGDLAELIDNPALIPVFKEFLEAETSTTLYTASDRNNVQMDNRELTLLVTRTQTVLTTRNPRLAPLVKAKLDRFAKEFLASVKLMQKIAALQQTQVVLEDVTSASTGLRTLTIQV